MYTYIIKLLEPPTVENVLFRESFTLIIVAFIS